MSKFTFERQPRLKLLTEAQIETIHARALELLEKTGVKIDSEEALKILKDHGATVDFSTQNAKIPSELVLEAIAKAPSTIVLYDREGNLSAELGGDRVYFDPGSAPINFMEADGKTVRPAQSGDLAKISRVNDALGNIRLQSTSVVLHDVPKLIGDSCRLYLLLKNSPKAIITGAFSVQGIRHMQELLAAVVGGEEELRKKPRAIFDVCPSPPLKWTQISAQNIIDCARLGLPIEIISVPMPGAASPATLSGSILLHTVETLSGLVLAQCASPGTPVVYGGAPMYFDMRHSTTSLNAMESAMISVGYAQMAKYYGLPTHTYACLSDAKLVDAQAGLESGMSALVALLAGINVVSGAGVMEFCNTFSLEKLVIDHEICGMALRLARGIDCSEDALAADLISSLGPGGDFLSTEHTFRWFRKEPYMPSPVIDRRSRNNWEEQGATTAFDRARKEVETILANHSPRALEVERARELDRVMKKIGEEMHISDLSVL